MPKIAGGLGFNIDIDIDQPSLQGSSQMPLLGASPETAVKLGSWVTLKAQFEGIA